MQTFSSKEVIDRLKLALSLPTDNALAEYLGVSKAALSNWKSRNTIDFLLLFSKCEPLSIDWVIMGRGEMYFGSTASETPHTTDSNSFMAQYVKEKDALILDQARKIGELTERLRMLEAEVGNKSGMSDTFEGFLEEATSEQSGSAKAG